MAVLDRYPEPEYEQTPMCSDEGCGTREISNPEPLDINYRESDIAPSALARIIQDCAAFQRDNATNLEAVAAVCDITQAGHNFWLSRNGHGSSFWDEYVGKDKKLSAAFAALDKASEAAGTCDIFVGDDGLLYIS